MLGQTLGRGREFGGDLCRRRRRRADRRVAAHLVRVLCRERARGERVRRRPVPRALESARGTPGWGSKASHFDRASARIGALSAGAHTIRFAVPGAGDGDQPRLLLRRRRSAGRLGAGRRRRRAERPAGRRCGNFSVHRRTATATAFRTATKFSSARSRPGQRSEEGRHGRRRHERSGGAISGTDPNNESEFFQCLEISATTFPTLGRILRWPSATGRLYSIYAITNLLTSDLWLLTSALPATPTMNVWTDTVSPDNPMLIYRIDVHR